MPSKTEAVKSFLSFMTKNDLASMYNYNMECQVNVAKDNGQQIEGEWQGVRWIGYSDSNQTWKPFRIPWNASTNPEYTDTEMSYDLGLHAEAIGMTGWDWFNRVSKWVAYDFDAIMGHSEKHTHKLTSEELKRVQDIACAIPWVTVRYSTSGKGLHLYVFLNDVTTQNHTEHAALARSILAKLSSLTGYDFQSKVDICGGNMWVWHRKMKGTNGLDLIKQGDKLLDIPPNWKDHVNVVKGTAKKVGVPTDISQLQETEEKFDMLSGQRTRVPLDKDHIKLITYLNENGLYHWFDADRHMLVTHTAFLKKAHTDLGLKGLFATETKASTSHNCFCYPMRRGAWSIRRFTPGVKEHASWDQDGAGWTRCYFNQEPTFQSAAHAYQGMEDPSGGYHFFTGEKASEAANALGANLTIPPKYMQRQTVLKQHKDGNRLIVEFPKESTDMANELVGWLPKGNKWIRIVAAQRMSNIETDSENYDDLVRHMIVESDTDAGWVINCDGKWNDEPLTHVKAALTAMSVKKPEMENIIGNSVLKPWTLVKRPFQPEYPGDRIWNRRAPQFRFPPSIGDVLHYPTWMNILQHIGRSLDPHLQNDQWFVKNGIKTGADYLKIWIASMFQYPNEPLPYLFIYSDKQNTGKSTLHEALELLFHPGYMDVKHALQNPSTFNGEIEGAILCVIEEMDLTKNKLAYDRIKEWVTSPKISIHAKHITPYMVDNTAHFIHVTNNRKYVPLFPGDTRITMIHVQDAPKEEIPKRLLLKQLEKEASDFLGAVLNLEIPESSTRLRIPFITTSDKQVAEEANRNDVQLFIEEKCFYAPGHTIRLAEFYDKFIEWLDPSARPNWATKQKVTNAMPDWVVKGRLTSSSDWQWGNISFTKPTEPLSPRLISINYKLVYERV